jgi:hypothetical protein
MASTVDYLRGTLDRIGETGAGPSPIIDYPELAAMYGHRSKEQAYGLVGKAIGQSTSDLAAYQREQEAAAKSKKAAELKAKLQELENRKPERILNEAGGYSFFDVDGKPISAFEYAQMMGKSLPSVLEGSLDPRDMEFQSDYGAIRDIYDAINKGDKTRIDKYLYDNPQLKGKVPDELMQSLAEVYPEIFTPLEKSKEISTFEKQMYGVGAVLPDWMVPKKYEEMPFRFNEKTIPEYLGDQNNNYYTWMRNGGR